MWIQIRMLLQEQSDLGLHCLLERLPKHFSRRHKQTTFVVIGVLRVNDRIHTIIDERVPSARQKYPWMNRQVPSAIRRKQWAYKKSRRIGKKKDMDIYKKLQAKVQFDVRSAICSTCKMW